MFARYVTKRLLAIFPSLFVLSIIIFVLRSAIPDTVIENQVSTARIQNPNLTDQEFVRIIKEIRTEQGLDLPLFYFSLTSVVLPDSLVTMYPLEKARLLRSLLLKNGTSDAVVNYYRELQRGADSGDQTERTAAIRLMQVSSLTEIEHVLGQSSLPVSNALESAFRAMRVEANGLEAYQPSLRWHGAVNQFHRWLINLVRLDFGKSIVGNQPVSEKVGYALVNTLLITVPALLLLILLSIPIGVLLGTSRGTVPAMVRTFFLSLDAVPLFWLAILLILLFASGFFLNILPAFGMMAFQQNSGSGFWVKAQHLILPVSALVLSALSYVSLQVMKSVEDEVRKLYVLAARARGLKRKRIIWIHIFRNSLVPIITVLTEYFSAAFAGSLVVEVIFSIPGMGKLLYDSVLGRDFNVIIAVVLFIALIKMIGNILSDIGYRMANPSISFGS